MYSLYEDLKTIKGENTKNARGKYAFYLFIFLLILVIVSAYVIVFFTPIFTVKQIDITNSDESLIGKIDIEKFKEELFGKNILNINQEVIFNDLTKQYAQIQKVKVKKRFPDKLEIEITAKKLDYQVRGKDSLFEVYENGSVERIQELPILASSLEPIESRIVIDDPYDEILNDIDAKYIVSSGLTNDADIQAKRGELLSKLYKESYIKISKEIFEVENSFQILSLVNFDEEKEKAVDQIRKMFTLLNYTETYKVLIVSDYKVLIYTSKNYIMLEMNANLPKSLILALSILEKVKSSDNNLIEIINEKGLVF